MKNSNNMGFFFNKVDLNCRWITYLHYNTVWIIIKNNVIIKKHYSGIGSEIQIDEFNSRIRIKPIVRNSDYIIVIRNLD